MIELWWIPVILLPSLLLFYLFFPRLYRLFFQRIGHLPLGFTAEKFNYLLTPLLTIIAVCTTYSAFLVQWKFNEEQSRFNREQIAKFNKERVEKIIYEFIGMHTNLVRDIRVTDITSGNRSFHFIYYECMSMREVLDSLLDTPVWSSLKMRGRSMEEVTTIAFKSCYFGISQTKNGALESWVRNRYNGVYDGLLKEFIQAITDIQRLNEKRVHLSKAMPRSNVSAVKEQLKKETRMMNEYFNSDQVFLFADGHMPVLDSYMRLLNATLRQFNYLTMTDEGAPLLNDDGSPVLTEKEREYYLDLLRSQLSSHELLIISLYAFTEPDLEKWFVPGYLSKTTGCKNDLVRDVDRFLIRERAGITHWDRYVAGDEETLETIMAFRREEMRKDAEGRCILLSGR